MDDPIALVAGHARAEVDAACGGALASFSFRGIDVLRPTPAGTRDVRLHACYPLVPYSNRIADARLQFEQRAWNLERLHSRRNVGYAFLMLEEVGALSASSELAFELS